MKNEPLKIKKRGEDGHKVISVRISLELLEKVDAVAISSNRSRNEVINMIIAHSIDNVEIE
ncbi:MAG: ribbon-helix-helix protein, CopG family [Oscillospiraceae bacterium]|nr:ribbon-helix-helix protein, CopG family [Oscillospiraceae bacterium]